LITLSDEDIENIVTILNKEPKYIPIVLLSVLDSNLVSSSLLSYVINTLHKFKYVESDTTQFTGITRVSFISGI
jgi:hypothetical protein